MGRDIGSSVRTLRYQRHRLSYNILEEQAEPMDKVDKRRTVLPTQKSLLGQRAFRAILSSPRSFAELAYAAPDVATFLQLKNLGNLRYTFYVCSKINIKLQFNYETIDISNLIYFFVFYTLDFFFFLKIIAIETCKIHQFSSEFHF